MHKETTDLTTIQALTILQTCTDQNTNSNKKKTM